MTTIPEITVETLAERLRSADDFVLLDVREPWELDLARIEDSRLAVAPMSELARLGLRALPAAAQAQEAEILILCHHGVRSAQAAAWLSSHGWGRAFSVAGGIDAYARKVFPAVGTY